MNDTSDYFFHFDVGIVSPLSSVFDLKLAYILDYQNEPYPPTLDKTDTALLVAIAAKF